MSEQRERIARIIDPQNWYYWDCHRSVRDAPEIQKSLERADQILALLAQPASGEARGLEAVAKIIRREMQDNSIPERIRSERAAALILEPYGPIITQEMILAGANAVTWPQPGELAHEVTVAENVLQAALSHRTETVEGEG